MAKNTGNGYRPTQAIAQLQKLQLADDRIIAYADHLDPGVYSLHYLVRSVTPGTFIYPGAKVYLQYAPEEFGRSADSQRVKSLFRNKSSIFFETITTIRRINPKFKIFMPNIMSRRIIGFKRHSCTFKSRFFTEGSTFSK